MILPQFSLRMVLALVALLGVASLILSRALNGSAWAMGVSVALAALVFAFLMYAGLFGLIYFIAAFRRSAPNSLSRQRATMSHPSQSAPPTAENRATSSTPAATI